MKIYYNYQTIHIFLIEISLYYEIFVSKFCSTYVLNLYHVFLFFDVTVLVTNLLLSWHILKIFSLNMCLLKHSQSQH